MNVRNDELGNLVKLCKGSWVRKEQIKVSMGTEANSNVPMNTLITEKYVNILSTDKKQKPKNFQLDSLKFQAFSSTFSFVLGLHDQV